MIINIISEWRRGKNISQKISTNNSQFSFMIKKNFVVPSTNADEKLRA